MGHLDRHPRSARDRGAATARRTKARHPRTADRGDHVRAAVLPLDRVAYLHAAGGARVGGDGAMWRDTHAHPIGPGLEGTFGAVFARTGPRPIRLERDGAFPTRAELEGALDALEAVLADAPAPGPPTASTAAAAPAPAAAAPSTSPAPASAAPSTSPAPASAAPLPRADGALRRALAERHHGLLRALLADVAAPPGFLPAHLDEARAILTGKQARACRTRSRASSSAVARVADWTARPPPVT